MQSYQRLTHALVILFSDITCFVSVFLYGIPTHSQPEIETGSCNFYNASQGWNLFLCVSYFHALLTSYLNNVQFVLRSCAGTLNGAMPPDHSTNLHVLLRMPVSLFLLFTKVLIRQPTNLASCTRAWYNNMCTIFRPKFFQAMRYIMKMMIATLRFSSSVWFSLLLFSSSRLYTATRKLMGFAKKFVVAEFRCGEISFLDHKIPQGWMITTCPLGPSSACMEPSLTQMYLLQGMRTKQMYFLSYTHERYIKFGAKFAMRVISKFLCTSWLHGTPSW